MHKMIKERRRNGKKKSDDSFGRSRSLGYELVIERTLLVRKRRVEASTKS